MWIIKTEVPYEGVHESSEMTTEEVIKFLGSEVNFDEICIRPSTKIYDAWDFIKEFKK